MEKEAEAKNKLYEQSETIVLKRSQIHEAPYNPKHHTKEQVKQIRENIQRVGLLGGIIWNKTTGNLIDGHKRIMALDIIHKYKETEETDYEIKVEAIELDEKTEKEQNIFQTTSRSELDIEMMSILIPEIDYELAGLTLPDLNVYLPASPIYDMPEYVSDVKKDFEALEKLTEAEKAIEREERKNDIIEKKRGTQENIAEEFEGDPYCILSFSNFQNKAYFMSLLNLDEHDKYVKGEDVTDKIN